MKGCLHANASLLNDTVFDSYTNFYTQMSSRIFTADLTLLARSAKSTASSGRRQNTLRKQQGYQLVSLTRFFFSLFCGLRNVTFSEGGLEGEVRVDINEHASGSRQGWHKTWMSWVRVARWDVGLSWVGFDSDISLHLPRQSERYRRSFCRKID